MFNDNEGKIGFFSTVMNQNNETYLIKYLNKLIHGILSATEAFANIKRAEKWQNFSYTVNDNI